MKKLVNAKILTILFCITSFSLPSYAYEERYVLEERNIKALNISEVLAENKDAEVTVLTQFTNKLNTNKSNVKITNFNNTEEVDANLKINIKEFNSTIENIVISDFVNYNIIEQQVKVSIQIIIEDAKTHDVIWKRTANKYDNQSWLDFAKQRIGTNQVVDYFYVPNQISKGLKKQYEEKMFAEKTLNEFIIELTSNIVRF